MSKLLLIKGKMIDSHGEGMRKQQQEEQQPLVDHEGEREGLGDLHITDTMSLEEMMEQSGGQVVDEEASLQQAAADIREQISQIAANPNIDVDGFTDIDDRESLLNYDSFTESGAPRNDVAMKLEHAMVHDPAIVSLRGEIFKKYGREVYGKVFFGDPTQTRIAPYEYELQDWFSLGVDNFVSRIRTRAEGQSKHTEVKPRFGDRLLRRFLPDQMALQYMQWSDGLRKKR